ncbi:MAG: hypothetical protein AB2385_13605 [Symbiobacterium sp.]|uniref:Uncharacterized protein n=1 Tax=Symbiobacterium thermophilum (strain DSM 24528 / JCM 14929 / IAM 14863 / T) TaxID=292459 RepID=Q67SR3_SYMTH|nr:hypothetical protein [Symbiobacterium thermophilum]BAD39280.1 hypothetical protein STH295 [Symbiobacterium thermophilum IAM 14863]
MPSGGEHQGRDEWPVQHLLQFLRFIATVALTILIIAVLGLALGPKDAGTVTLYALVIGLNALIALLYWPVVRFVQRRGR